MGRDEVLAGLADQFAALAVESERLAGRVVVGQALAGMGGIGKSELALQYAHARCGPGALVWWVTAETADQLLIGLADLAYRLHPAARAGWTSSDAADWAIAWLQAHTGWLLVLDNLEDPLLLDPLLGQLSTGDLLITTRRTINWAGRGLTSVSLNVLTRPASVALLHQTTHPHHEAHQTEPGCDFDAESAERLAEELGDLPLALEQAGAYIHQQQITITAYLHRLATSVEVLDRVAESSNQARAVARVWTTTAHALAARDPATIDLLNALAWLAPDNIPRHILTDPSSGQHDLALDEMLGLLASYSMITLTPATVSIHRLLQTTLRTPATRVGTGATTGAIDQVETADTTSPGQLSKASGLATEWLSVAAPSGSPSQEVSTWPEWAVLVPHIQTLAEHLPSEFASLDLADLLGSTGFYLWVQGRNQEALTLEQRALTITETALGGDHPTTATRLDNLAQTLHALARYDEALPLQHRALTITETALGADHPSTATRLNNLASTLHALARYDEALPLRRRALTITETALGGDHPDTGVCLDNLAHTLNALGRYDEALPLRQRALTITETALGADHPDTATRLDNLAHTLNFLGRYDEALPLQHRALTINETALGADHPNTATRLDNLAHTLNFLGRYDEALPLQQRALAITETALGADHPATATRLNNLAHTLNALARYDEALPLQHRALAITETALGGDHPDTANRLNNLAHTLYDLARYDEALPLQQRALTITETALGADHPTTATRLDNLAQTRYALGRYDEALPLLQRALTITETTLGGDHPTTAIRLDNLAATLHALGRYDEALPLQQRALTITETTLGGDHPDTATRLDNLAHTLYALGRSAEALPLLQRALAITETTLGGDHPLARAIRDNVDYLRERLERVKTNMGGGDR